MHGKGLQLSKIKKFIIDKKKPKRKIVTIVERNEQKGNNNLHEISNTQKIKYK